MTTKKKWSQFWQPFSSSDDHLYYFYFFFKPNSINFSFMCLFKVIINLNHTKTALNFVSEGKKMSLEPLIMELCRKMSRPETDAIKIIQTYRIIIFFPLYSSRLKENWYDDIASLESLTESDWTYMKLPIRFYSQLQVNFCHKSQSILSGSTLSIEPNPGLLRLGSQQNQMLQEIQEVQKEIDVVHTGERIDEELIATRKEEETKMKEINLLEHLLSLKEFDFEEIISNLNSEAEKEGLTFKKGNTHYYPDGGIKYRSIICNYRD